jgi:ubiquinone/menaquinone biosynthesis C-methylase UbiE
MNNITRKKIIRQYYSRRANDYDGQKSRTWKTSQGFGTEVIDEMLEPLAGFENKHVLEVGVGNGRNALPLMERVKPRFVGLDVSREMLELARTKMASYKQNSDAILADAEHLPFMNGTFDAIICISAMHYFESQEAILEKFSAALKEKGVFVYGDLTIHEADDQGFFEKLERTLSKAHARYYKPTEMQELMESRGFHVSKSRTVAYGKSYRSLMEDKGEYFNVPIETLQKRIHEATAQAKAQYGLTNKELTLYYTIIVALKEN